MSFTPANLPANFLWLQRIDPLPKMVAMSLSFYGLHEGIDNLDNPTILAWAEELGLKAEYTHDSIPWCGLYQELLAHRCGYQGVVHPMWALNWSNFGVNAGQPILGDILVFTRPGGAHVGLYIGESQTAYYVLGGNEGDAVKIVPIDKHRLHTARRPAYNRPSPLWKPYLLGADGSKLSVNEA